MGLWQHIFGITCYYLPLLAPPLPQGIPGIETPLASEELPVCSRSPEAKVTVIKPGQKMLKDSFFYSPVAAVLTGYWLLLSLCGTDLQAPGVWLGAKTRISITSIWWEMNAKMNVSTHLCSISCFMSMPCFSSSSLWAKAQSTGSAGVSAHGVLSRSRRACSGSLKRNTWLFPMMMRFPKECK